MALRLLSGVVGITAIAIAALLGLARPAAAHDVPDELVFNAYVAPEAEQLHVPLRVPLVWLADYPFPKRGPGYIDLADTEGLDAAAAQVANDVAADIALFENGRRLEPGVQDWQLSLPSDRSFDVYREALAGIAGASLPSDTNLFWNQGFFDVHLVYPIDEESSRFSLQVDEPALAERLHILTTFVAPDGGTKTYDLLGSMGRVELNPGLGHLIRLFAQNGLTTFLTGWEHVLFVAGLALALARRPSAPVRPVVTFGVMVSLIVLAAGPGAGPGSIFGELAVATAAAASLLVVAVGNIMARNLRLRWLTAGLCGVPHGLLLVRGLDDLLQFRSSGDLLPLVAYAVGALVGAAVVFGATLALGWLAARHAGARRHGPVVAALLIGYVGWRDTLERGDALLRVPPPPVDAAVLLQLGRWAAAVMLVMAGSWLVFELLADRRPRGAPGRATEAAAPDHAVTSAESGAAAAEDKATVVVAAAHHRRSEVSTGTEP